ncbi:MAG: hypothetical protein ABUL44_01170, partial [Flavobacterium sp.]
ITFVNLNAQNPWIIRDDFSSNSNYWHLSDDSTLHTYFSDDGYHVDVKGSKSYTITKRLSLDEKHDYKIEMIFQVVSTIDKDLPNGLTFGAGENAKQAYDFVITGNGIYAARQITLTGLNDIEAPKFAMNAIRIGIGKQNKLTVTKREGYWEFFINDVQMRMSQPYPFVGDRIGFFVNGKTHILITSFKVYDWTLAKGLPQYEKEPVVFTKLYDNFYDNKKEWVDKSNASANIYLNNYYEVECKTDGAYGLWNFADVGLYSDCLIETELEHISGTEEYGYGLIFGLKDIDNFFYFKIADGGYKITSDEKDEWRPMVDWTDTAVIRKGNYTPNHLEVRSMGKDWKFFINGHLLESLTAKYFFGKNFGLYVEDKQKVRMNYIKVAYLYYPKD